MAVVAAVFFPLKSDRSNLSETQSTIISLEIFAFKEIMMQVHPRTCIFLLNSNPLLTTRATRVILYL